MNTSNIQDPQKGIKEDRLVLGAVAASNIATIIQLTGRETFSIKLYMALALFGISIPLAVTGFLVLETNINAGLSTDQVHRQKIYIVMFACATITSYLAFLLIFWHFHNIVALIFLFSSFLGVIWYIQNGKH
jgi:hypothetical protein